MFGKHKIKRIFFEKVNSVSEDENTSCQNEIDEAIAHQISIDEITAYTNESVSVRDDIFERDENDEIKVVPCVVLGAADADDSQGFDFSSTNGRAVFAKRAPRNRPKTRERTSLRPENIESEISPKASKKVKSKSGSKKSRTDKKGEKKSPDKIMYLKNKLALKSSTGFMAAAVGAVVIIIFAWGFTHKNANEIYVGDKLVGTIKDRKITAEEIKTNAVAKLKSDKGIDIKVKEEITLKAVHASKKDVSTLDYAISSVCDSFTYDVGAAAIVVNGKQIGVAQSRAAAEGVFSQIYSKYTSEGAKVISNTFVEDVKIEDVYVQNNEIETSEDLLAKLSSTTNEPKTYKVVSGDTISSIADNADMSLDDFYNANPGVTENLQIDQVLNLVVPVPVVSVKTVEESTYEDIIYYTTEYRDNPNEYRSYERVVTQGQNGKRIVTVNTTKINGIAEGEPEIVSAEVLSTPITRVVERGTM